MNSRRKLLLALGAAALTMSSAAVSQPKGKVWRIGYLGQRAAIGSLEEAFRQGLRELGYLEGQNLVIEWRFTKRKDDLLPNFAAELVRLKVDCSVTHGANAILAARQATSVIPIVMASSDVDPMRLGVVASLGRPGGNVTGFMNLSADLAQKRLELLKETVPNATRIGILWDPDSRAATGHVRETRIAARKLGVRLLSLEVWDPEDLDSAFRAAAEGRAEALIVVGAGSMDLLSAQVITFAAKLRLPVMNTSSSDVAAGGLMSYAAGGITNYRGAAGYVDRILRGTKPADLPVVQPTIFELVVNLKTAKVLGITFPPTIMVRATRVIE